MYDFFQLRVGQCFIHLNKALHAEKSLITAAESESPAVQAAANYRLAVLNERNGRYLQARMKAYMASSAFAALSSDYSSAQTDCEFLIARVLTKKALTFYGMDHLVSWGDTRWTDPFATLDEADLRKLLNEGVGKSADAMLGPKISRLDEKEPVLRWTATCLQTSISDLLSRFATKAKIDLHWALVNKPVRNRPVSLHFRRVTGQKLCELACGSAGLVARFTGEAIIVYNPTAGKSMNRQRDLLLSEAISAWRRIFLRTPRDKRVAEGHFAIAVLYEHSGNTIDAINEYQLTAQRFGKAKIAAPSLLRSANLRMGLRDYTGARTDLTDLLDSYPDCRESGDAYAALGEATFESGLTDEALRIFKKLYFLNLSAPTKSQACFGIGKCFYQKGDYKDAIEWLDRYIKVSAKSGKKNLPETYLLLGGSYLATGKFPRAAKAFHLALSAQPKANERVDALTGLAQAYRDSGNYARAIVSLRRIAKDARNQRQNARILSLTAQCYRAMGLPEKGASFLRGNITSVTDSVLRAQVGVELAQCYYDANKLSKAYATLTSTLEILPPGDSAHQAACNLAKICLKIGKADQAITLTRGVLNSSASEQRQKEARKILADAYLAKRQYEKATMTLTGMKTNQPGAKKK
jgi:tetratricopeptide (TPR) repeat protein